jgi:hypothetical protein
MTRSAYELTEWNMVGAQPEGMPLCGKHQALRLFHEGEWECAITLALAAEEHLPETKQPHLWSILMEEKPEAKALLMRRGIGSSTTIHKRRMSTTFLNLRPLSH